jgi:hypothetical protein
MHKPSIFFILVVLTGITFPLKTDAQPVFPTDKFGDVWVQDTVPTIFLDDAFGANLGDISATVWTINGGDSAFRMGSGGLLQGGFGTFFSIDKLTRGITLGVDASTDGTFSIAMGDNALAEGAASITAGRFAVSSRDNSMALGNASASLGPSSSAVGHFAVSGGANSTALGYFATAGGAASTALGWRATAPEPNTVVLGAVKGKNFAGGSANVAIGTTAPQAPLHLFRDDDTQVMFILESEQIGDPQDRAMMLLANNGGIRFEFQNPALSTAWRFQAATGNRDNFEVTKVGSGSIEFKVDASGNATLAGLLFENSDVNAKANIEHIDPGEVLARVATLPISEWEYKDTPGQRHVGPMAQDFYAAFGLGVSNTSLATIDTSGVALASIKALALENQSLRSGLDLVTQSNRELQAKLDAMERLVTQLASQLIQP